MQVQNTATFSIIVPLFNEEENIYPLVRSIIQTVGADSRFMEIVLVDDGSYDKTAAAALKLAADDNRIRLVRHERNQGLGAAIRTGLEAARGDFVLYTDADLPFDFALIPQLFSLADKNRVVTGYRLNRGEGGRRLILTKVYNSLIWLFFGLYLRDVNFACKIFPRHFLQKAGFNSLGSFIDVEILLEARRFGLQLYEHPLVYYPRERGLSTLSRPGVILFILKEMLGYIIKVFSYKSSFLEFVKISPLAKIAVYLTTALTSIMLLLETAHLYQGLTGLLLTIETGAVSLFLGWRVGLMTVISTLILTKLSLFSQQQSFLSANTYYFLFCTLLGIVFSQLVYRNRDFFQKPFDLKESE